MEIKRFNETFSVCKLMDGSGVNWHAPFCFLSKTDEELSLVCLTEYVPAETLAREDGWQMFRIQGTLDFTLVGILARIASLLDYRGISIFTSSTYNTDYILVKTTHYEDALLHVLDASYCIV